MSPLTTGEGCYVGSQAAWVTSKGDEKEAWVVDYADLEGERRVETFSKKKAADARPPKVEVD